MRNALVLRVGVAVACTALGCLQPASQLCGNGGLCPPGLQCAADGDHRICVLASCGNGRLDEGEACDDGNNRSGDGCPADCTPACGDGVRDPNEACDDGNTVDGDGCSADCSALDGLFLVSPSAVHFEAMYGDHLPASVTVRTRLKLQGDTVRVGYPTGVTQPGWLTIVEGPSTPITAEHRLSVNDSSIATDRSTSVRFVFNHANSAGMEIFDLPVDYHIAPSDLAVQAASSDLAFTAEALGAIPPAQTVSVTFNGGSVSARTWPLWATVTPPADPASSPATFTISINNTAFSAGTSLTGDLVLLTTRGTLQQGTTVHLRYQVAPFPPLAVHAAPGDLNFMAITGGELPPPQVVQLTFNGVTSRVVSAPPWVTVGPPSVPTASPAIFAVTINNTSLPGGTMSFGDIVLGTTRQSSQETAVVHVVYSVVNKPEVHFVAPYIGIAGRADTLHVRGQGFLGLESPITVAIGDLAIAETPPDADAQLTVSYPAMPEGRYRVQIVSPEHPVPSSAELVILAPPAMTYQAIASPGRRTRLVYDDERRALYAVNRPDQQIDHFAYADGQWSAVSPHVIPQLTDIAMAPNGKSLIVLDADQISEVALTDDLFIAEPRASNPDPHAPCRPFFNQVAPADNGKMYVLLDLENCSGSTSPYRYDLLSHSLSVYPVSGNRLAVASGDGSRIYACGEDNSSNAVQIFNSLTSTWSSSVVVGCSIDAISVS